MTTRRNDKTTKPEGGGIRTKPLGAFQKMQKVARMLDMSPRWVRQRIEDGDLRACKFGKDICVDSESLADFLANRQI